MNKENRLSSSKSVNISVKVFFLLLCLIGILDGGSTFGFIFKFLFGKAYLVFFAIALFLIIYSFTKRKNLKINKLTIAFLCVSYFFLISMLSQKASSDLFNNLFKNYIATFKSSNSSNIIQLLSKDCEIGGGLLGDLGFAVFGSIFGIKAAYIVCFILCLVFAVLALIPLFKVLKNIVAENKMRKLLAEADKKEELLLEKEEKMKQQEIADSSESNVEEEKEEIKVIMPEEDNEIEEEITVPQKASFKMDVPEDFDEVSHKVHDTISVRIRDVEDFDVTRDDIFSKKINTEKIDLLQKKDFDVINDKLYFEEKKEEPVINDLSEFVAQSQSTIEEAKTNESVSSFNPYSYQQEENKTEEELDYSENTNSNNLYNNYEGENDEEQTDDYYEEENNTTQDDDVDDQYSEDEYEQTDEIIEEPAIQKTIIKQRTSEWRLPPISLLNEQVFQDTSENEAHAQMLAIRINTKLKSLNVPGEVVDYLVSPAFTRFRIRFAPEYRLSNFKNLELDLQAATEAKQINLLPVIPGDNLSGVDIPNIIRSTVSFKECFVKLPFNAQDKKLLCAIGKDCLGNVIHLDITKTQHLLVAGQTGSGKSGGLNSVLCSIIMRSTPDDVRMLLIDKKLNEFKFYVGLPHLVCPVVFRPEEANEALKRVCKEITIRNEIVQECEEAIDIESYNNYQKKIGGKTMPYFVIAIDELQFLMQDFKSEIEDSIKTITAVGRSVGVYIICCTQSPRKEVVTGIIKANLPSTLAFSVKSPTDSQVILGEGGAEKLLPPGDMLMDLAGQFAKQRVQGCFVEIEEKRKIIQYWKDQGEPEYLADFIDLRPPVNDVVNLAETAVNIPEDSNELLYEEIKKWLVDQQIVSISSLQRHFQIGQPRAGRMIDMLEKDGFISPSNGFKSRTVFRDRLPK